MTTPGGGAPTTVAELLAMPRKAGSDATQPAATAPLAGPAAATATGDRVAAVASATAPARGAAAAAPSAAAYRTLTPQAVQLTEQARDSVFKQILFRLDRDGGEMRLRLDPPELGELDLRLNVDKGGQLRLSIGAERSDLAQLLRQDLDQLKDALQRNGLHVVHAEVHAHSGDTAQQGADEQSDRPGRHSGDQDQEPAPPAVPGGGYVTAAGLDFWV